MNNIITLKDKISQNPIYPITKINAVITENGEKFIDYLDQKLQEANQLIQNAVSQAQAAEEAIVSLNKLNNNTTAVQVLSELEEQIENNKLAIATLLNKYNNLQEQLSRIIDRDNITTKVTGEIGKIPTSMAVRNYVASEAGEILNRLINTTTIEPNYVPENGGQILVNTETCEIFISPGIDNRWFKLDAELLELPESIINTVVENDITDIVSNDTEVTREELNIPNQGKVEDDTLIL